MGFVDRFFNGAERVVEAMEEGWEKRGLAGVVGYGASAIGGEAFVQPLAAGMSLIGKGDAIDQKYQRMFDDTITDVARYDDDHAGALISLGCNSTSNTAKLLKASYDAAKGKDSE